jgi:hypothetical protein
MDMPDISNIPIPYYQPLDPYNHIVDNQPIHALADRTEILNAAIDINTSVLIAAAGNQGTVGNRLSQSINQDGSIKSIAIDNALHSIEAHLDSGGYVRMTLSEREKLDLIADGATNLNLNIQTISGIIPFSNSNLNIYQSDTVNWRLTNNKIYADAKFPETVHRYDYGAVTSDYQNYKIIVPYKSGNLRVYVNGVRVKQGVSAQIPTISSGIASWTSVKYLEGVADSNGIIQDGSFSFTTALNSNLKVFADADMDGGEGVSSSSSVTNGTAIEVSILQSSHGFSVGNFIRYNGTSYVKADATTVSNASVIGMVSKILDNDNFVLTFSGKVIGVTGLIAGTIYYLSATPGAFTSTAPSIRKPVLLAVSSSVGYLAGFNLESNLLGIYTDGSYNLLPNNNNTQTLGGTSNKWSNIYSTQTTTTTSTIGSNNLTVSGNILNFDGKAIQNNGFGFNSAKITQNSHGFVAGDVLRLSGALFIKAQADSSTNSNVVGIVKESIDANNFLLITEGHVIGLSGLTSGTVYYLSPTSAGTMTGTEPVTAGQVSKPLLVADSATSGYFVNWRGSVNASAITSWSLTGNAGTTAGTNFVGTTDIQDLVIKTGDGSLPQERVRVKGNLASGSVLMGVNIATPLSTLDISGSVGDGNITAVSTNTTLGVTHHTVIVDATSGAVTITLPLASGCTRRKYVIRKKDVSSNAVTVLASGADQIDAQTSVPLWAVYQTIEIESDGTNWHILGFWNGSSDQFGNVRLGTGAASTLRFHVNTSEKMRLTSTGLGLNQTVPTGLLELGTDDARKPSTNTWTIVSDGRVKKNVLPYEKGLSEIERVNPVKFEYNGKAGFTEGMKGIGVIAQDVKGLFPDSVKTYRGILDGVEQDIMDWNSHELTYALINAVKTLSEEVKKLKSMINLD